MYAGSATKPTTAQVRLRGGVDVRTMTGNETVNARTANYLALDPGGSDRTITLPAAASAAGLVLCIAHTGTANSITVQTAAPATVVALAAGEGATVGCSGSAWALVGPYAQLQPDVLADPGDAGAIPVTSSGTVALTSGAGAETRTVAIPTFAGQTLDLSHDVDGGGNVAVTFAAAINQGGNTVATFANAGEHVRVVGVTVGGSLVWRLVVNNGTLLS